ncbi:prostatic acid phosphatase-like [Eublepharis macularius]|uniref:acid phosphatase n=1 Tax=Eublepharis macularius TaxID=481883 RepID=A0AA97K0M3_EUBMA|nr:prostatic acid phosphatase-like [Eublepharis macularius]
MSVHWHRTVHIHTASQKHQNVFWKANSVFNPFYQVYRHGDRSPISTFPTNECRDWPQGFGQLTREGMKQQYKLGKYLRNRYRRLLSPEYKRKEIYVLSTDTDRTIMSAQTNLAGLFPPSGKQIWHHRIPWQPIPVHTLPRKQDRLLSYPIHGCTRFNKLLKETLDSGAFKIKLKDYMPFLGQIAPKLGYDVKTLLDVNNQKLWNAYDTLLVQRLHQYRNPDWADQATLDKMKSLLEIGLSAVFGEHKREEKARVQGGLLVKAILEEISKAASNADPRKMMMYSAHDTTIVALQTALDVSNKKLPPYAACHLFELYQESNGQHTIEMYYQTDVTQDPTPLTLPGCSKACPLDKFKQLVAPIIVDNWEAECTLTDFAKEVMKADLVVEPLSILGVDQNHQKDQVEIQMVAKGSRERTCSLAPLPPALRAS